MPKESFLEEGCRRDSALLGQGLTGFDETTWGYRGIVELCVRDWAAVCELRMGMVAREASRI
jgi:hypothetical protein